MFIYPMLMALPLILMKDIIINIRPRSISYVFFVELQKNIIAYIIELALKNILTVHMALFNPGIY